MQLMGPDSLEEKKPLLAAMFAEGISLPHLSHPTISPSPSLSSTWSEPYLSQVWISGTSCMDEKAFRVDGVQEQDSGWDNSMRLLSRSR